MSNDGRIRLDQNSSGILDVFAADVDTRAAGTVFYGLRNDSGVLEQYVAAAAAIDSRFAGCYDRVFTVTWDSVGYFDQKDNPVSVTKQTLQIICKHEFEDDIHFYQLKLNS